MPAVVIVPGATGAGRMRAARADARRLAAEGILVASFNAEGRSSGRPWDIRSSGTSDLNGPRDQDGLAAVVRAIARRRDVDPERVGVYTISFGLAAATGAIARHPDLPIRFIVDEEGPTDCFAASLRAWTLAHSDGDDWPQRALNLFKHPCPDSHTNTQCHSFWASRSPILTITKFRGHYLRLQATYDHVQPPQSDEQRERFHQPPRWWHNKHAIDLANTALDSGVPWVQINPSRCGNPTNARWSVHQPPHYIPGKMTDHPNVWTEAAQEVIASLGERSRRRTQPR